MKFKAVFFDLDGTLTDPAAGITRCIRHALERLGCRSPSLADLERFIGPDLRGTFRTLLDADERVEEAIGHYRDRFIESGMYENEVYDGVRECLGELRSRGLKLSVVTSKPRVFAAEIIDHFELRDFFEGVYGATLDGSLSDKADLIRLSLERQRMPAADVVMIGDRRQDIVGAMANDVLAVGALWGYGTESELRLAGARHLCERPAGIVDSLANLRPGGQSLQEK